MPQAVQLPNGSWFPLKEGEDPREALAEASKLYPDAFGTKPKEEGPKKDTKGLKAAAAAGFERLGGEYELLKGKAGFKDEAEAQKEYEAAQARAAARFTPTEKGWTEDPFQKFKETLGGSIPYMLAPAAAGIAALAAPVAAPVAAGLGLAGAGALSAGQFTASNLGAQLGTGKSLQEASLGKAVGAAIPQALMDTAAMALLPGIGKLFGSVGSKLTTAEARAIAEQSLGRAAADYTAKTGMAMGREGLTETAQQVLERLQAGLSITDPEARKEYVDSFIGGAALAGAGAPIGRYTERSAAKSQAAQADAADKKELAKQNSLAQQQEQAQQEAERNKPEYALQIADQLQTLEQQKLDLKSQIRKISKDSTTEAEDKAHNKEINAQLQANSRERDALAPEKNRLVKSGLYEQALEERRVAGLTPEEYALEQTKTVTAKAPKIAEPDLEGYYEQQVLVPSEERRKAEAAQAQAREVAPAQYAAERMELARTQTYDPTGQDYLDYLLHNPFMAQQIVETKTPLPGVSNQEASMLRNDLKKALAGMNKEELAARQADLQAQKPGQAPANPMAAFMEQNAALDTARQEGFTEADIAKVEKQAKFPRAAVQQGELFGTPERINVQQQAPTIESIPEQLTKLQQQLNVARAARNAEKTGGRGRMSEGVSNIIEQMRLLQEQQAKGEGRVRTPMGEGSDALRAYIAAGTPERAPNETVQEWYSRLPESSAATVSAVPEQLKKQQEAVAARVAATERLQKTKTAEDRQEVLNNLVSEIQAARGPIKPETITEIENEANALLDQGLKTDTDITPQLDQLSNRWRAGTRAVQTATKTATPTTTSIDMLRDQMDRAYAQRDRLDEPTLSLLDKVVDNFNAFAANPERLNIAGEWLNRAMTTGKPSPEMTRDLQAEVDALERAKISETQTPTRETAFGTATKPTETAVQEELPGRFMPKQVAPETTTRVVNGKVEYVTPEGGGAPAQKGTAFGSAAEFQKFLAGDALKAMREAVGLTKQTASRMHERLGVFRRQVDAITKQLAALQERKAELQRNRGAEANIARTLVDQADANLKKVYERLDNELRELQVAYLQARQQFEFSANTMDDIGKKIADNIAQFENVDAPVVEAAQATAAAKTAFAEAQNKPVTKKNFSDMRKARQRIIDALQAQRKLANVSPARFVTFINADLNYQLQMQEEERVMDAAAQDLLNAGLALEEAAAKQQRSRKNQKELSQAQQELSAALGLQKEAVADVDKQLAEVTGQINQAQAQLRTAQTKTTQKAPTEQEQFAALLEAQQPFSLSTKELADKQKASKDRLAAFQARAARLAALPGQRIDFAKRRGWLELVNASDEDFAALDQDAKDVEDALEFLRGRNTILAGAAQGAAEAKSTNATNLANMLAQDNDRIAQLEKAKVDIENRKLALEKEVARAEQATSSDPEVVAAITESIDKRLNKLDKTVDKKKKDVAQTTDPVTGKPVPKKTMAQRKKDLAKYEREQKRLMGLRSNRLGITRIDTETGTRFQGAKATKATQEELIQAQEANERDRLYTQYNVDLLALKNQLTAAEKSKDAKAVADINKQMNKLRQQIIEVAPSVKGRVSPATRVQSAAPAKMRTGTEESRANAGVNRQPITEQRKVAPPTAQAAVADANEFAERITAAKQPEELANEFKEQNVQTQADILKAVASNVQRWARTVSKLEDERDQLQESVDAAEDPTEVPVVTRQRLADVREQLGRARTALTKAEDTQAQTEKMAYASLSAPALTGENVSTIGGWNMGVQEGGEGVVFRTVETKGKSTLETQQVENLAKRVTEGWVNAPAIKVVANEKGLPVRILTQLSKDEKRGKVPGLYDTQTKTVYLVADALHNANDVILTIAHEAAGHHGLRELLGGTYTKVMDDIFAGNKDVREQAKAKMAAEPNLSQQVAVEEVLAELAEKPAPTPAEKNALQRIYAALKQWFAKTFNLPRVTDEEVQQLVAHARQYVIEGREAAEGQAPTGTAVMRTKTAQPTNDLEQLAADVIAQPKTWREKMGNHIALQAEMQAVDMRAGLQAALKAGATELGDENLYTQAMYNVRKADQKMPLIDTVMRLGPLELYKDEKGLYGVRSTQKNSAKDVLEAVAALPYKTAAEKDNIATIYMIAQRAANKGLSKLDLGALGVTEEKLAKAMAVVDADPALKAALENVRRVYNEYNKGLINFLVQTRRISKAFANDLLKDGDYVPYYRVQDNGLATLNFGNNKMVTVGDIRRQPYLAQLKGGETKILPISESLPRNTLLLTDMALTNMATRSVAYGLQAIGKGKGEIDSKTGKPKNLMAITPGKGPADGRVIRFYEEPDPNKPDDTGERFVQVDTGGTAIEGIPAELVVQSLEGAHLALPEILKLAGAAGDLLRTGVTRTPLYIARQLFKDPMAAAFTGGLEDNSYMAVLKAGREFVRMTRGQSENEAKLLEKGLIQSGIFAGDVSDMKKMALQIASGKETGIVDKIFAAMDRAAMRADATTRALVMENALKNGLSEVEADMATMESMNFYKRGLSPTIQYANRLIPFLNAQIQGLNVLIKAATGNASFQEQQQIKRKFVNNAVLLTTTGIVYAMAMEDDEYFRNAKPKDKYSNFFLHLPGVDEPVKLPIPYEAGYFFSLGVAAVDGMREETDGKAQWRALKDMFLGSIPGYSSMGVPQLVKPAFEVWTNKNFLTGAPVESLRLQGLDPEQRYNTTTTELAKSLAKAVPILSPIQIEHLVRGYLGVMPLAAAAAANSLFETKDKGESPEGRASDLPLVGTQFQKKFGGADNEVVFHLANESKQARSTFNTMLKEGRRDEALEYRDSHRVELASAAAAGQYQQLVGRINLDVRRTQERNDLTGAEKRERLDKLEEAKQAAAQRFIQLVKRLEDAQP